MDLCCETQLCVMMAIGLGDLAVLPDALILDVLSMLDAKMLGVLAAVSKSLYVFTYHEDNWRCRVLEVSSDTTA